MFSIPLEGDDEELELLKRKIERERGFNCKFYKVVSAVRYPDAS